MKKHYQIEQYPIGDCFRACISSILCKDDINEVPNFMKDGECNFDDNFDTWKAKNEYQYIEVSFKEWESQHFIPDSICVVVIKNNAHPHGHAIVGKSYKKDRKRYLGLLFNPQKGYNLDNIKSNDILSIGFLSKEI